MIDLFTNNVLPVFLVAGTGYLLSALLHIDARPLARVAFYVLAPCLIYQIIVESEVGDGDFVRMSAFATVSLLALAVLATLLARAFRWPRPLSAAVGLVVLLPNAGNFGLPVNLFAYGKPGLAQAGAYFVTSAVISFTVGVFVASAGRGGWLSSLTRLVKVPAIWAVPIGFLVARDVLIPPLPVALSVELMSGASIPVFLLLLGMQLHGYGVRGPLGPIVMASAFRLLGGAAAGLGLAGLFGLEGVARQAAVVESAMPTAIISIVLATEYDLEPRFVTSVVVVTTLVSPLTVSPLLWLLAG